MLSLIETASPLEILVSLLALAGVAISAGLLASAWRDLSAVWPSVIPDDPDVTTAWVGLLQEGLRLVCLLAILAMGIALMLQPPFSGSPEMPSTLGLLLVFCMLLLEVCLVAKSVIGWLGRRKIAAQAERLRDSCADCPWPHAPLREVAQAARGRRVGAGGPLLPRSYAQQQTADAPPPKGPPAES